MHHGHRYFDISHYRAPYKNSVLSGYGQDAETPHPIPREDSGIFDEVPTDEEWDEMLATAKAEAEAALARAQSSEEVQAIKDAFEEVKDSVAVQKASAAIADAKAAVAVAPLVTWGVIGLVGWGVYRFFTADRGGFIARPTFTQNRRRARR